MQLAYFIALHHKVEQFRWIFDAVYSPADFFIIHIDKTSPPEFEQAVASYVGERANVQFLPRQAVTWGGWSQVRVELEAMDSALYKDHSWSYFVNISGQDYPIRSRDRILEEYAAAWPRSYIRAWNFDQIRQTEPDDPHLARHLSVEIRGRVIRTWVHLPTPRSIDMQYKGAQWHALTRDACAWIATSRLRRQVARRLKYSTVPDEMFFQTMIMNGPFRDLRMDDCGREVIWPGPKILRMEDYSRLAASSCLYARKFDESVDRDILVRLAQDCGYSIPGNRVQ